ncbi:unnamed protein product [Lactuca saligna]|uniref:Transposase MuDR plant domain-containing protein n=1 Tax=Lactuca saligna TaxID=75948 RepID=A0AA35YY70_LACSI|nr:unnamed protein product [Lactuca saligna]
MGYEEFKDLCYVHVGVEKASHKLNISLCYQFGGQSTISRVISDSSLDVMYYLAENVANYWGQVLIEVEKIMSPTSTSFVDLLQNFEVLEPNPSNVPFPLPDCGTFEGDCDEANSLYSEDTSSESLCFGEDSDDDGVCETPVMNFMRDVGDIGDGDIVGLEDRIQIDVWKESENKIRLGMQFESKLQVKKEVTLWSINQNREFKVYDSKPNLWVAKYRTLGNEEESSGSVHYTPRCAWYVRAVKKKKNIFESLNNALRGARQLPIRACLDLTFNRTVQLFRNDIAMNCNTPLPSCVYRIVTKLQINDKGGNTYTVHYFQQTCTCESDWKIKADNSKLFVH